MSWGGYSLRDLGIQVYTQKNVTVCTEFTCEVWGFHGGEYAASCSHLLTLAPRSRFFIIWRRRRYVPLKHQFAQGFHGAISQTTAFCTEFICLHMTVIYIWLYSPLDLGRFFSFLILYIVCRTQWTRKQPVARPLPTHRTTQTQNKHTQTSVARFGFEPTIAVLERPKTVRGQCDVRYQYCSNIELSSCCVELKYFAQSPRCNFWFHTHYLTKGLFQYLTNGYRHLCGWV
jgi:hypothetical protein